MNKYISPFRALVILSTLIIGFSVTSAASEVIVPGLESHRIIEHWVDGDLVFLKDQNGRLYTVPLASVELTDFSFSTDNMDRLDGANPSLEDILELIRAGVSEPDIRAFIETSADRDWRPDLTTNDLVALKRAGAGEKLIQFLLSFDRARPGTTTIAWKTPFSPRKDLSPSVEPTGTNSPAYATVQEGIPYFPYVYPGYGTSCPIYPVYPIHPIEKPDRGNRKKSRAFYPRQSQTPVPAPYSRARSTQTSRSDRLWIRWSLPRAGGSASAQSTGESSLAAPSSPRYRTYVTGSSFIGGNTGNTGSAGATTGRSSSTLSFQGGQGGQEGQGGRGSSSSRGSGGGRGAFSRARSNK